MSNLDLQYAEMAVKYVKSILIYGADNRDDDIANLKINHPGMKFSIDDVRKRRHAAAPIFYGPDLSWTADHNHPLRERYLLETAVDAMASGQGRCDEQAALAYYYLVKRNQCTGVGVFALHLPAWSPGDEFGHCFVLMGLKSTPDQRQTIFSSHVPSGWMDAVWCDPWANQWFEIKGNWPDRLMDTVRQLSGHEKIGSAGLAATCRYYHDGSNSYTAR